MRALAIMLLVLPLAAPALGASTTGNDCGLGQDADHTNPPVVTLPRWCEADVSATSSDVADKFFFDLAAGDQIHATVRPYSGASVLNHVCIESPAIHRPWEGKCTSGVSPGNPFVYTNANPEPGRWEIRVSGGATAVAYVLRLATNVTLAAGTIPVGTAGAGISASTGPGSPATDGAWHALPTVGTGHEGVDVVLDRALPTDVVHVRFFHASGGELIEPRCGQTAAYQRCPAPVGASWALVELQTGALQPYRISMYS